MIQSDKYIVVFLCFGKLLQSLYLLQQLSHLLELGSCTFQA